MNTDLDHAVRTVLADIIAVAPQPDGLQHGVSVVEGPLHPKAPRRAVLVAAACLVVAGLIGGGVALRARSTTPSEDVSSSTSVRSTTTLKAGRQYAQISAMLPVRWPPGFYASDAGMDVAKVSARYTVWSSCNGCAEPTGAVALVRQGQDPGTTEQPGRNHQDVTVKGRTARYYPATTPQPETSLVSVDGKAPGFGLYGWGIDLLTLTDLATGVIDGQDVPSRAGLVRVFDGEAGGFTPGLSDNDASLDVTFTNRTTGATIEYSYQHSTAPANIAYLVYTLPFAKYSTILGHPAITSTYGDISEVVVQPDDNTVMVLSSRSAGVSLSDLTSIEFTMAAPSDTRWLRLESEVKKTEGASAGLDGCILPLDKVQPGDTPATFAARAGVTVAQLTEANNANPAWNAFAVGSDIVVPIPSSSCVPPVLPTPVAQDTIPDCSQPGVTVTVPNAAGMAGDAAIALLNGTGLRPDQLQEALPNGVVTKPADFAVVDQGLAPGAVVACGSAIRIVLAYKPGPLHVVQQGDTYDSIAASEGLTVEQLLDFNGLTKLQPIGQLTAPKLGQALRLSKPIQRG